MSDEEKLARQKKLLLKGLVPAVDHVIAQYTYFKMKVSANTDKSYHKKASANDLSAHCTVNKAQQANMSPTMSPSYVTMNQT
eukprot:1355836-Ditylum_brightwellii.AAC.1